MRFMREMLVGDSIWRLKRNRKRQVLRGKILDGLCDPSEQTIYVYAGLKGKPALVAAVHEFFHILEDEYEVEIGHGIIEKIEEGVAQFLIDNFLGPI